MRNPVQIISSATVYELRLSECKNLPKIAIFWRASPGNFTTCGVPLFG